MIKLIFVIAISFFVVGNAYAQFDSDSMRDSQIDFIGKMTYLCLQIDELDRLDQMEDKEQQQRCEEL